MKKRNLSKFTAIVLLITTLSLIALAGTYAKYTASFNGTGTVTAAKWDVKLKGDGDTYAQSFTLTAPANSVYPGGSGTLGTITVKNESEIVKAKITSVTVSEIKVKNNSNEFVANPITNFTIANPDVTSQTAVEPNGTATVDINYNWTYSNEVDETAYAGKDISFKVTVTVDQVQ